MDDRGHFCPWHPDAECVFVSKERREDVDSFVHVWFCAVCGKADHWPNNDDFCWCEK